jgi:hypothetical protein
MIVPNYAGWRVDIKAAGGKVEMMLPVIAWWIDETDRTKPPVPITPLGPHDDPAAYDLVSNFGTLRR